MANLNGKSAVITGAASGIGRASVQVFVNAGAKVVAADIMDDAGQELVDQLGADKVRFVHCDVTQKEHLQEAIETCVKDFGSIDALFNNAGAGGTPGGVEEFDPEGFDGTVNLLLKSVIMGTHLAVPYMKQQGGGSVINTSSISALSAGYAPLVYSLCKIGVAHFAKMAGTELAKYRIRVNSILPGFIATRIFGSGIGLDFEEAGQTAERIKQQGGSGQPLGRPGHGEDIAEMAAFLASDAAQWISGGQYVVDGAYTAGPRHSWDPEDPGIIAEVMGLTPEQVEQMQALMSNQKR